MTALPQDLPQDSSGRRDVGSTGQSTPLHQPPNPADLRRAPPADPACARVRGWLRDFVDQDLARALARELEEHVHTCRTCAVELARTEHELLKVRRAFHRLGATESVSLPPNFAARVVDRLILDDVVRGEYARPEAVHGEDVKEGTRANEAGKGVPALGRGSRLGGVGPATVRPATVRPATVRPATLRPATVLASALLLVLFLGIGLELFGAGGTDPQRQARLVVLQADGTYDLSGRLRAGSGLDEQQSLWVVEGGGAFIEWHDLSANSQPAATLQVHGSGQVRMESGAPLIVTGRADIVTKRPVSIPMGDGSRLDLGVGEYSISAETTPEHFEATAALFGQDPLSAVPRGLSIAVEVKEGGQDAAIVRAASTTLVSAGHIGVYQGNGSVSVASTRGPMAGGASLSGTPRVPAADIGQTQAVLYGHAVDRSGAPAIGADVLLSFGVGGVLQAAGLVTGADGSFAAHLSGPVSTPFAIRLATPPPARRELGVLAPDAELLVRNGAEAQTYTPLIFDVSVATTGVVRDELGAARSGVQVLPCIVDEWFGTVLPLVIERALTAADGSFRIDRLPARLPPHQALVLLFVHDDYAPVTVPVPLRGSSNATLPLPAIQLRPLRAVRLHMLPANAMIDVLEELPGLPPSAGQWRRRVTTDSAGRVPSMLVGHSRLWFRLPGVANLVRGLELGDVAGLPRFQPSGPAMPYASVFQQTMSIPGTPLELVSTWRHQRVAAAVDTPVGAGRVLVIDEFGRSVAGVQVFSVGATGPRGSLDARFLGFTSSTGTVPLAGESGQGLVALAADGSSASLTAPLGGTTVVTLPLARTGRVLLAPALRPQGSQAMVTMRFQRIDEPLPGMPPEPVRFASAATGWEVGDLPPGQYRVTMGNGFFVTTVPAGGFVELH